ncbi:ABC transporter substrate-binding protein [Infirmifilum sp. NZ]|uniref:ABC transporter substrate-binding protein n=1 Tax=Infirmifilum sp. NZ TaxID=2926850 RepID=UPI0027A59693|nr:ABC transporter substrate-binding protein [Infirmifilum sp. NZ]UNQ73727.1 ABC transporter substrate-binding protein [Infirmifilum sp. NZ]
MERAKRMNRRVLIAVALVAIVIVVGLLYFFSQRPQEVKTLGFASTQLGATAEKAFLLNLLGNFTKETGVPVDSLITSQYSDVLSRLEAEQQSGKVTISLLGDLEGNIYLYADRGWVTDMSKFGTLPGRTFISSLEATSIYKGQKVFIPWMTATYVFVVNAEAFNYLPPGLTKDDVISGTSKWTYDALLAWAKNIYEKTGKKALGFPVSPSGLFHRFLHGCIYPSYTGYQVKGFDSPEAVAMWAYLKELWNYVNPASSTYSQMADPLLKEEVWIAFDHIARIKNAVTQSPDKFYVVPVPAGPKGRGLLTVVVGLTVMKGAPAPDEAWKLIEFLTRPDVQVQTLQATGFLPTTVEAAGKVPQGPIKSLVEGVNRELSLPDIKTSYIPPLGAQGSQFSQIYRTAFERIVLKGEDPGAVLSELKPQLLSLFQQAGVSPDI